MASATVTTKMSGDYIVSLPCFIGSWFGPCGSGQQLFTLVE